MSECSAPYARMAGNANTPLEECLLKAQSSAVAAYRMDFLLAFLLAFVLQRRVCHVVFFQLLARVRNAST
jgi:hypothetical protein